MKINYTTHPKIYRSAHKWVREKLGKPISCANGIDHIAKRFEWANLSGKYLYKKNDWINLCPSCHRKMDFTEETRQKLSKSHIGQISTQRKSIIKKSLKNKNIEIYNSITDAAIKNNILRTSLLNCLKKRTKTSGGFIWEYL
jgi:hypothetical protein